MNYYLRETKLFFILMFFTFSNSLFAQLAETPWPMMNQNNQRTNSSIYKGPRNPELKWQYTYGEFRCCASSPVIDRNDNIYIRDLEYIYSFNSDGVLKWKTVISVNNVLGYDPTINKNNNVYVDGDYLYAINNLGQILWQNESIYGSIAIDLSGRIIGTGCSKLFALNSNGTESWTFELDQGYWVNSPSISQDNSIYVTVYDDFPATKHKLYSINSNGHLNWVFETPVKDYDGPGLYTSVPAVDNEDNIYFTTVDSLLYSVNSDGNLNWTFKAGWQPTYPAIGKDGLYICSENKLFSLSFDGTINWVYQDDDGSLGAPVVDNSRTVYVSAGGFYLKAISPTGQFKWKFNDSSNPVTIGGDNLLYTVAGELSTLYAIESTLMNSDAIKIKIIESLAPNKIKWVEIVSTGINGTYSKKVEIDYNGYATFSHQDIFDLYDTNISKFAVLEIYLLDDKDSPTVIGKIDFKYDFKNVEAGRTIEPIIFFHNNIVSYQEHPTEKVGQQDGNKYWNFPILYKGFKQKDAKFYQTSMLIPPVNYEGSFLISNIKSSNKPILFVHGITGTYPYWGDDKDIIEADDNFENHFNDNIDYAFTSNPGRLRFQEGIQDNFDIWEYYYPPDQAWTESGYILGEDIHSLLEYYNEDIKISIVAHSMGGLVTRAYIEETAQIYKSPDSTSIDSIQFKSDIDKVLFLATPQHGAFAATRAYWNVFGNSILSPAFGKDPYAPALRELALGSMALIKMNQDILNSNGVTYLQFSVTTTIGTSGFFALSAFWPMLNESLWHEDGAVAICSGNLFGNSIPFGLLKNFSHSDFKNPDNKDVFADEDKNLISKIIRDFLLQENYSAIFSGNSAYNNNLIYFNTVSTINPDEVTSEEGPINLDVCLPLVSFKKPDGDYWKPEDSDKTDGQRFMVSLKDNDIVFISESCNNGAFSYNKPGQFLYYGDNNYTRTAFKETLDNKSFTFYAYEKEWVNTVNQFAPSSAALKGVGWHVPIDNNKILPVYIGYQTNEDGEPWYVYKIKNAQLNLKWSQATYHTFNLDQNVINILESNQYAEGSEEWIGPSKMYAQDSLIVWLDSEMDHASVLLNFGKNTEPLVELVKPDGTIIQASDADGENLFYTSLPDAGTKYFTVANPDIGKWKIHINGQPFLPDTSYKIVYPMKVNNWLVVSADTTLITASEQALITAGLYDETIPVSNLSMESYYYDQSGNRVDLILNDDGTSGDVSAGDGVFSGYYSGQVYGSNLINAVMRGEMNGSKFLRQDKIGIYTYLPAPILLSPGNSAAQLDTSSVSLIWQSDSLLSNYTILVSSDSLFTQLTHYYAEVEDTNYTVIELVAGQKYFWRVKGFGNLGEGEWSAQYSFTTIQPTSINTNEIIPNKFELKQNYPNPFNPVTTIEYSLPTSEKVKLLIYDALGRKVVTLVNARQQAGKYSIQVQIPRIASGVYFYKISAGKFQQVKKMLLIK